MASKTHKLTPAQIACLRVLNGAPMENKNTKAHFAVRDRVVAMGLAVAVPCPPALRGAVLTEAGKAALAQIDAEARTDAAIDAACALQTRDNTPGAETVPVAPVFTRQTPRDTIVNFTAANTGAVDRISIDAFQMATQRNGEDCLLFDVTRNDGAGICLVVNASGSFAELSARINGRQIRTRHGKATLARVQTALNETQALIAKRKASAQAAIAAVYAEPVPVCQGDTVHGESVAPVVETRRAPPLWQGTLDDAYAQGRADGRAEVPAAEARGYARGLAVGREAMARDATPALDRALADAYARGRASVATPPHASSLAGRIILPPHADTLPGFAELADRVRACGGAVRVVDGAGNVRPLRKTVPDVFLHAAQHTATVYLSCGADAWRGASNAFAHLHEDAAEIAHGRNPSPVRWVRLSFGLGGAPNAGPPFAVRCGDSGEIFTETADRVDVYLPPHVVPGRSPTVHIDPFTLAERRARRAAELLAPDESTRADLCAELHDTIATYGRGGGWRTFLDVRGAWDIETANNVRDMVRKLANSLDLRAFGGNTGGAK